MFGNVVHLGAESESVVCWRRAHQPQSFLGEYIHGQGEGLMATCDSVLVELWVWSEVICLLVIWWIGSRGQSMGNPPNLHVQPCQCIVHLVY